MVYLMMLIFLCNFRTCLFFFLMCQANYCERSKVKFYSVAWGSFLYRLESYHCIHNVFLAWWHHHSYGLTQCKHMLLRMFMFPTCSSIKCMVGSRLGMAAKCLLLELSVIWKISYHIIRKAFNQIHSLPLLALISLIYNKSFNRRFIHIIREKH